MPFFLQMVLLVLFWVFVLWKFAWITNKLFDMFYQRKGRPKKTKVRCPKRGDPLTDFELFYGHCSACKTKGECRIAIKKVS